jgi:hypothetical protein
MGSYRNPTRVDLGAIKQDLHDALGENGLPYWKALNGYLLGQIGKSEMESMVKGWLKGKGTSFIRGPRKLLKLILSRIAQSLIVVLAT